MSAPTTDAQGVPGQLREDAFRELCATYDPLLKPDAAQGGAAAREALEAFGLIFDLTFDDSQTEGDIWRQVRPRLARQMGEALPDASADVAGERAGKVFLPSRPDAPAQAFSEAAAPLALLLVEDDPDLAAAVVEALSDAGHSVVGVAAAANQAGSIAALHAIDIAIIDVELEGGSDGVELARSLYERWGLRSLFVSGSANEALVDLPFALGFVGKPFSGAELLAALTMAAAWQKRDPA